MISEGPRYRIVHLLYNNRLKSLIWVRHNYTKHILGKHTCIHRTQTVEMFALISDLLELAKPEIKGIVCLVTRMKSYSMLW